MKVHRYSEHHRRMWVFEMVHKTKSIKAICAEAAISRATLYNWLSEFSETATAAAASETGSETPAANTSLHWQPNDRYKMLVAALVKTDKDKSVSRQLARELVKRYNLTIAQACELVNMPEETYGYRPRKPETDDKEVYAALVHLLQENSNRSLEDCITALQQAHPEWAIKQVKRIYRQGRLYLKRTRIRRVAHLPEVVTLPKVETAISLRLMREGAFWHIGLVEEKDTWMLFVLDYNDGIPLNTLAGTGQATEADMMQLVMKGAAENGTPRKIRIPAIAPFLSRDLTKWSWDNRVAIYNLSMAKPENALEAGFIQDDIKKQLGINEATPVDELRAIADRWIAGFAQNIPSATNYFAKEEV